MLNAKLSFALYTHFRQLEVASSATVILLTLEQDKFTKFKKYEEKVKESTAEGWIRDDQLRKEFADSLDKVFVINANSRQTSRVLSSEERWRIGREVSFGGILPSYKRFLAGAIRMLGWCWSWLRQYKSHATLMFR